MTPLSPEHFEKPETFGPGTVWVDRIGPRQYRGHTQKGVTVEIGTHDGQATPGELLKIALIGCAGMSMDHAASRRLGEDFAAHLYAHGLADEAEDRYLEINEQIQLDLGSLSDEERAALAKVLDRVIDAACTIQRTVTRSAPVHHTYIDAATKESAQ